jgi:DNA repair protein RecO (recombination protein O)
MNFREKVFVLKKVKYGEADLILTVINSKGSKFGLLARGAAKSKKRFSGGILEPTHYLDIIYKNKDSKLGIIEEAHLIKDFHLLRLDYDRLSVALSLVDKVYRISQEGDIHGASLFNLLGNSLTTLEKISLAQHLNFIKMVIDLKILQIEGILEEAPWMEPLIKKPLHLFSQWENLNSKEKGLLEFQPLVDHFMLNFLNMTQQLNH